MPRERHLRLEYHHPPVGSWQPTGWWPRIVRDRLHGKPTGRIHLGWRGRVLSWQVTRRRVEPGWPDES